jgi:endogenous inhibitor of DNA gyrase (YacG/DUF329 family)
MAGAKRAMTAKIEDLAARRAKRAAESPDQPATAAGSSRRACPICGRPQIDAHRPFCSTRCAEIDLGRWLKEGYRVPGASVPDEASSETDDPA